jgi:hypothetical protein
VGLGVGTHYVRWEDRLSDLVPVSRLEGEEGGRGGRGGEWGRGKAAGERVRETSRKRRDMAAQQSSKWSEKATKSLGYKA